MKETVTQTLDRLVVLFLEFFVFSVCGWIFETIYCSIIEQHFVDRGFLYGPYCPIYGFACIASIVFFSRIKSNVVLAVVSGLVVTVLEFFTSIALEQLYHARWWDYSNLPFNLDGRICLFASIVFALGTLAAVRYLHPLFESLIERIPLIIRRGLACAILTVLLVDTLVTHEGLMSIRDKIDEVYGIFTTGIDEIYETLSSYTFM